MICPRCRVLLNPNCSVCPQCGFVFSGKPTIQGFHTRNLPISQSANHTGGKKGVPIWSVILAAVISCCASVLVAVPITSVIVSQGNESISSDINTDNQGGSSSVSESSLSSSEQSSQSNKSASDSSGSGSIVDTTTGNTQVESSSSGPSATPVGLNETITTEKWTFTLTSAEWTKQLNPPDTSSIYSYLSAEEGKSFLVVRGSFKNLSGNSYDLKWGTDVECCFNDNYNFYGMATAADIGGNDFYEYTVTPLETVNLYLVTNVPDDMKNSYSKAVLHWKMKSGTSSRSQVIETYELTL